MGLKENYEPQVFYFDNFRESKGLNYNSFLSYKAYLENKEDIVYSRFSKALADVVSGKSLNDASQQIANLTAKA